MNPQLIAAGLIGLVVVGGFAVTEFTDFQLDEFSFVDPGGDCTWTAFQSPSGETFSSTEELFNAYEQATGNSSEILREQVDFRVQNGVVQYRSCAVTSSG